MTSAALKAPIGPTFPVGPPIPLTVASHVPDCLVKTCPNEALPKLARGRTPELEGASTIHSADDNFACGIFVLVLNDWFPFFSVTVNSPPFGM